MKPIKPFRRPKGAIYDNESGEYKESLYNAWFDETFEDLKIHGLNARQIELLIRFYESKSGKKAGHL